MLDDIELVAHNYVTYKNSRDAGYHQIYLFINRYTKNDFVQFICGLHDRNKFIGFEWPKRICDNEVKIMIKLFCSQYINANCSKIHTKNIIFLMHRIRQYSSKLINDWDRYLLSNPLIDIDTHLIHREIFRIMLTHNLKTRFFTINKYSTKQDFILLCKCKGLGLIPSYINDYTRICKLIKDNPKLRMNELYDLIQVFYIQV